MPEEKKKSEKESTETQSGQMSRRSFLKDAGLVVGAPAIGSIAVSTEARAQAAAQAINTVRVENLTIEPLQHYIC